jgi:hypothetical protein
MSSSTSSQSPTPQDILQRWTAKNAQGMVRRHRSTKTDNNNNSEEDEDDRRDSEDTLTNPSLHPSPSHQHTQLSLLSSTEQTTTTILSPPTPTTAAAAAASATSTINTDPNPLEIIQQPQSSPHHSPNQHLQQQQQTSLSSTTGVVVIPRQHRRTLSNMSWGSLAAQTSIKVAGSDSDSTETETASAEGGFMTTQQQISRHAIGSSNNNNITTTTTIPTNNNNPLQRSTSQTNSTNGNNNTTSGGLRIRSSFDAPPPSSSNNLDLDDNSSSTTSFFNNSYEWIKDLDLFVKSPGLLKIELKYTIKTRSEEVALRSECSRRGLIAHEANRYNARLALGHGGGFVHVVEDEMGRTTGEGILSDALTRPKLFRVGRHRSAVLGPLLGPLRDVIEKPTDRSIDKLLQNFVLQWASPEFEDVSMAREHALLILREIVHDWVRDAIGNWKPPLPPPTTTTTNTTTNNNHVVARTLTTINNNNNSRSITTTTTTNNNNNVLISEPPSSEDEHNPHNTTVISQLHSSHDDDSFEAHPDNDGIRSDDGNDADEDDIVEDDDGGSLRYSTNNNKGQTKALSNTPGGGTVLLSGSACFGVSDIDSDVDAVCLVPRRVTRDTFFTILLEKLKSHPQVSRVLPISNAHVPVIRCVIDNNVSIDLLMARLDWAEYVHGDVDILDDEVLENMDPISVTSLSGPRNADMIRNLVPNYSTFCATLRIIRFWAKRRAIYSSKLGYLGGVSWAIIVAMIVQLCPQATPARCVFWFFEILSRWDWARTPIRLCDNGGESWRRVRSSFSMPTPNSPAGGPHSVINTPPSTVPPSPDRGGLILPGPPARLEGRVSSVVSLASYQSGMSMRGGGLTNSSGYGGGGINNNGSGGGPGGGLLLGDENSEGAFSGVMAAGGTMSSRSPHLMPIITPSSPCSDSAANVISSTCTALKMEFARGRSIMRNLFEKNKSVLEASDEIPLFELFAPFEIVSEFVEYIRIDLRAETEEAWSCWLAFVESRLRKLTLLLESVPCVERVRIDPECKLMFPPVPNVFGGSFYVGVEKNAAARAALSVSPELSAHEQDEAIERTLIFFAATHLKGGRIADKRFDVEIIADCLQPSSSRRIPPDTLPVVYQVELNGSRVGLERAGIIIPQSASISLSGNNNNIMDSRSPSIENLGLLLLSPTLPGSSNNNGSSSSNSNNNNNTGGNNNNGKIPRGSSSTSLSRRHDSGSLPPLGPSSTSSTNNGSGSSTAAVTTTTTTGTTSSSSKNRPRHRSRNSMGSFEKLMGSVARLSSPLPYMEERASEVSSQEGDDSGGGGNNGGSGGGLRSNETTPLAGGSPDLIVTTTITEQQQHQQDNDTCTTVTSATDDNNKVLDES